MKNIENLYKNVNFITTTKNLTADQKNRLNKFLAYAEQANFLTFKEASEAIASIIK